jgi:hypothetical protein
MFRTAILSSVALMLAGSAASASPGNVITFDVHGVKVSILTDVARGQQQPRVRVPGAVEFNNLNLKYPNATFIPWQAFVFGDANDFAAAFTTSTDSSQRLGGYNVALQLVTGPGGVTVCLEDDNSGVPSGNCVAGTSAYFSNAALPLWGFLSPTLNVTFPTQHLAPSTQYWVVATPDPDTLIAWDNEDTDFVNPYTFGQEFNGAWSSFNGVSYVPALEIIR